MGLLSEYVEIGVTGQDMSHFEKLGYKIPKRKQWGRLTAMEGTKITVKVQDLTKGSNVIVSIECDNCHKIEEWTYQKYNRKLDKSKNGQIFCNECNKKMNTDYVRNYDKNGKLISLECKECHEIKPIEEFGERKYGKDGVSTKCKQCTNKNSKRYTLICEECGSSFSSASRKRKYCSTQCSNKAHDKKQYVSCEWCKTIFPIKQCNLKKNEHHFCSKECHHKWQSENTPKGENHPNWNPNLTEEERNNGRNTWENNEWKSRVFERDNYQCQCCGDDRGGNLEAHHKNCYSDFKDQRCEVDNGITLCKKCHAKFHKIYGYGHNTMEQFDEFMIKYEQEYIPRVMKGGKGKKIICLTTGEVFNSIKEAGEYYNITIKMRQKSSGNKKWMYYEDFKDIGLEQQQQLIKEAKQIYNNIFIYDGEEYDNIKSFANKHGISDTTLRQWLQGKQAMPQEWYDKGLRYKNKQMNSYKVQKGQYKENNPSAKIVYSPNYCEGGKIWLCHRDCQKDLNVSKKWLGDCIKNNKPCKGYIVMNIAKEEVKEYKLKHKLDK